MRGSVNDIRVQCLIDSKSIRAVIDTAADVTVISESVYASLGSPTLVRKTKLRSAAEGQTFTAKVTGPVKFQIGDTLLFHSLYVAPIHDDMLLGMDVLNQLKAKIDLGKGLLTIPLTNDIVRLSYNVNPGDPGVSSKVYLHKHVKMFPFTEISIPVPVKNLGPGFCILEPSDNLPAVIPSSLQVSTSSYLVNLVNMVNNPFHLQAELKVRSRGMARKAVDLAGYLDSWFHL